MKKYTLSKNYKERISAGNKAKTDIEHILTDFGYANAGLRQATYQNPILGFFHTFISVIKSPFTLSAGDVLLVQYPFKKIVWFDMPDGSLEKSKGHHPNS